MFHDLFGDLTFSLLGKALDVYSLRHRVSANNLANVNTPGFKRSYVPFEAELMEIIGSGGDPAHDLQEDLNDLEIAARVDHLTRSREDGNNVDMEQEIAEMTKNSLLYSGASAILKSKLTMYRYVINEGRR